MAFLWRKTTRHAVVWLGLLTLSLAGQDRAAAGPEPTKPLLVLEMDGPDALRQAFLPTNAGTMLASQDARGVWPALWDRFHRAWYGNREQEPLLGYGGRIRMLAFVEPGRPQRERGLVVLEPDRKASLARIGQELSTILRSTARAAPVDREAGGLQVQTVYLDTPGTTTLPREIDGRLVSFFGREEEIDWVVAEGLRSLAGLPAVSGDDPPFSVVLDLAQVAVLARADAPGNEKIVDEVYGLASLRNLEVTVGPAGPRVLVELGVRFGDGPRGIFAGLMPAIGEPPTLASLVPEGSQWLSGHLGIDPLMRTALTFLSLAFRHGPAPEDPLAEARAEMRRELGFDLFEDLLAHLGDEVLVVGRPGSMAAQPRIDNFYSGLCVGVSVRVRDPLERNLLTLLEEMGLSGVSPAGEYRGVGLWKVPYHDGSGAAHLCVTPELLLVGFDDDGLELLKEVLAARASGRHGMPVTVRRAKPQAPPGWNGTGVLGLRTAIGFGLQVLGEWMGFRLRGGVPEGPLELLEGYGLGEVVVLTGYRDSRWVLRLLW